MRPEDCNCDEVKPVPPPRETVARLIINSHLRDTLPDIDMPREPDPLYTKHLKSSENRNIGIYTETRALLNPPPQSRFDQFNTMVRESVYKSNRDMQLSKPRFAWSKPPDVTIISRTFGKIVDRGERLYDVVMPPDIPKELQLRWRTESVEKRRIYPYVDPFNNGHTFGKYYKCRHDGFCTERCMHWIYHPANICVMSQIQGLVRDRTWAPDGVVLEPLKNRLCRPKDFAYGLPSRSCDSVANQLRECDIFPKKAIILRGIMVLNSMRKILKNRAGGVNFGDLLKTFRTFDKTKDGLIQKEAGYLLMRKLRIDANFIQLEELLRLLNILNDEDQLDYEAFLNIFNYHLPYPELEKIQDIPDDHLHYTTTYADFTADRLKPFVPNLLLREKPHECDARLVLNTSICSRNGLHRKDYLRGRSKEVMRDIFTASGYQLSDEVFEQSWTKCLELDAHLNGAVSVDTFREYVEQNVDK